MAEGKKSFQMYTEWADVFNELDDSDAGELIKHVFAYVNDKNPVTENKLVALSFIQMKHQFKRDLEKWRTKVDTNRANGAKGGRPKNPKEPKETERLILKPKKPVEVEVEVEDEVEVKDKEEYNTALPFSFMNSLIKLGADKKLVSDWLKVRKTKKLTNTETAFKGLVKEFDKSPKSIDEILTQCCENSWGGFKASWKDKNEPEKETQSFSTNR